MTGGSQLAIQLSEASLNALRESWKWKIGDTWKIVACSAIGDVFLEVPAGSIWWLGTATGDFEQVASSRKQFEELLASERVDEWFLPGLVDVLQNQGKLLERDQCYTYTILPIFSDGSFCAENMYPVAAGKHFTTSGRALESIRRLPDGARVQVTISE